jgi:uncharacterized protein (TIGR00369 family)
MNGEIRAGHRYHAADAPTGSIPPALSATRSGIELLRDMIAGKLPGPGIARTLNFLLVAVDDGYAEFHGVPLEEHYNPAGTVHGGWTGTLLDSALGCAVQTKVAAGFASTTIEYKVNLVRPMFKDTGRVVCAARVIHMGRTTAVSEATLKTADGKLVAIGTETCSIFPLKA